MSTVFICMRLNSDASSSVVRRPIFRSQMHGFLKPWVKSSNIRKSIFGVKVSRVISGAKIKLAK